MSGKNKNEALMLLYNVIFHGLLSTRANFFLTKIEFIATKNDDETPKITPERDHLSSWALPNANPDTTRAQQPIAGRLVTCPKTTKSKMTLKMRASAAAS